MEYKIGTDHKDGMVFQHLQDPSGQITTRVVNVMALQMDKAIAAELIRLGWTPPPGHHGGQE